MKRNQFYKYINIIVLLVYLTTLNAKVHTPIEDEENIILMISGKEITYYELDDGLIYDDIGKQYDIGDSIKVGIYSRTIMASSDKKNKKYGFRVTINDNKPLQLKYKKEGSDVTSLERPGWSYSKSGIWYFYLPIKENGYKIKIKPLDKKPIIYLRLTSNKIKTNGNFTQVIKTVNQQNRIDIVTNEKKRKYYMLTGENQQLFEIQGPAKVRVFSRMKFDNNRLIDNYYIFVREDGIDLGTYYFQTEKSTESSVLDSKEIISKWRSLWLTIPEGKHYYTFTLPNIEDNLEKTVYIRLKEWQEEQ
jgi:hypothetical protein